MSEKRQCENCKYRFQYECRYGPPYIVTEVRNGESGYWSHSTTEWPRICHDDWCGKFEQKETSGE